MNERVVYLDWLRILAALMVVMIHTSGMLYVECPKSPVEYYLGFWNMELVRSAVPIFFMISGALLLRPGYDANPRKMVLKAAKALGLMLIWSFVYALVNVHPLTIKGVIFSTLKGPFHFWFFEYLIGIYLLTPVFKAIADYKSGKLVEYYLMVFVFFGIIIDSLQAIPFCHKWIMDVTTKIHVEWLGFAGYFFLGHYLTTKRFNVPKWVLLAVFLCAVILQGWCTAHLTMHYASDKYWILTFIEAAAIFMLFPTTQWMQKPQQWLTTMASLMMGVYILHPFISENIPLEYWTASLYGLEVAGVFGGALLASWLIMKIPVVGKWLLSI